VLGVSAYEISSFLALLLLQIYLAVTGDVFGGSCLTDRYAPVGDNLLISKIQFGFHQKLDEWS
jgi:hypothetical protein